MMEERLNLSAQNCFENMEQNFRCLGNWKEVWKMSPMEKKTNNKNTFNFVKCIFFTCQNYFISTYDNCYHEYMFCNFYCSYVNL